MLTAGLAAAQTCLWAPRAWAAATARCAETWLRANIDPAGARVHGEVRCRVGATGTLYVGDYAAVLDDPATLDELQRAREYPEGFSPAAPHAPRGVPAEGGSVGRFWRVHGEVVAGDEVRVAFDRPIPARQGTFSLRHGVAYLLAGWHPVFAGGDFAAPGVETRPVVVDGPLHYAITLPPGRVGLVGRHPVGKSAPRTVTGRHFGVTLPVVVAPAARVRVDGASVSFVARDARNRPVGHDDVSAARDADASWDVRETVALAHAMLAQMRAGASWPGPPGTAAPPTLIVQVPLRHQLAEAFEGGVAVSDRAFHLPPPPLRPVMRKLHQASLLREVLAAALRPRFVRTYFEGGLPAWVSADACAAAVRAALCSGAGGAASLPDLLDMPMVSPGLDALRFAPQVPFADTWAEPVHEDGPQASRRFDVVACGLPRGKLLLEKARDRHGEAAVRAFATACTAPAAAGGNEGAADVLTAVAEGGHPDWPAQLVPWLQGNPARNYGLGAVTPVPGGGWLELTEHRATAAQPGERGPTWADVTPPTHAAPADATRGSGGAVAADTGGDASLQPNPPNASAGTFRLGPAPVDVLVVDADDAHGQRHRVARLGPGPVFVPGPLPHRRLQLDPGRRLGEASPAPSLQAGLNNRRPGQLRALLNDVGLLVSATDYALAASVNVGLRRLYDLRYDYDFAASIGPGTASLAATASRHFGPAVTNLRLADAVAATLSTSRLRAEGVLPGMGQQLALALGYVRDTRPSRFVALRGYGLRLQASLASRVQDGRARQPYGSVGAAALGLVPLGGRQALVGRVRADFSLGDVPAQTMLRLGGRYTGARGFEMGEARGKRRALVSAEWRHVLAADTRTDLWGLITLTRLEGALFADAAWLPVRRPTGCRRELFSDVGYGVRILGDVFGVSPSMLAIDVGLPFGRCGGRGLRPVSIYVDFAQSFVSF